MNKNACNVRLEREQLGVERWGRGTGDDGVGGGTERWESTNQNMYANLKKRKESFQSPIPWACYRRIPGAWKWDSSLKRDYLELTVG